MNQPQSADPHVVLGVTPGVSATALRHAYAEQVRRVHPDTTHEPVKDVAARLDQLRWAYRTLRDDDSRSDDTPALEASSNPTAPASVTEPFLLWVGPVRRHRR